MPLPKTKHEQKRTLKCKHLALDKWEHGRRPRASQKNNYSARNPHTKPKLIFN